MVMALDSYSKVQGLKPMGDSKVNSVFYPLELDEMNHRKSWKLSGKR